MNWINDCLLWIFPILLIVRTVNGACDLYTNGIVHSHSHQQEDYDNNMNCSVKLTAPKGNTIQLSIFQFDLEPDEKCQYDFLKIYDGNTYDSRLIGTYCGTGFPGLLTSTSQKLMLHFHTDGSEVYTGFKGIAVARVIDRNCIKTIRQETGVFTHHYIQRGWNRLTMDCTWSIPGNTKRVIEISRNSYWSRTLYEYCGSSYVKIYKKNRKGQFTELFTLCHEFRRTLSETSDEIIINMHLFVYVYAYTRWDNIFTVNISQTNDQSCNAILTDTNGAFKSPDRDGKGNYGPFENCSWIVTARSDYRIILTLYVIEIEEHIHKRCTLDYIMVYEGDTIRGTYCGNNRSVTIESNTNKLLVIFHTDQYRHYKGFNATYKQIEAPKCREHLTNRHGSIHAPVNASGYYFSNLTCEWVIDAGGDKRIHLHFEMFDIDCRDDSLKILINGSGQVNDSRHFCGNATPSDIISNTSHVKLLFRSDSMYSGKGFKLTYRIFQDKSPYIKVTKEKLEWANAAKRCEETNGILAIPRNEEELEAIQMALEEYESAWIGSYSTFTPWSSAMDCYHGNQFPVQHLKRNSITSCFELCKPKKNILLQDNNCACIDPSEEGLHAIKVNYSMCNRTCPGSYSDLCGGTDAYLHYKADTHVWSPGLDDYNSDCAYIEVHNGTSVKEKPQLKFDTCSSVHGVICKVFNDELGWNEILPGNVNYTTRDDAMQICQDLGGILVDRDTLLEDYNPNIFVQGITYWVNMKRNILKSQLIGDPDSIKAQNYRCHYVNRDTSYYGIKNQDCSNEVYFVCRNESLMVYNSTSSLEQTEGSTTSYVIKTKGYYSQEMSSFPVTAFNENINKDGQGNRDLKEKRNHQIDYGVVGGSGAGGVVLLGLIMLVIIFIRKRKSTPSSENKKQLSVEPNNHQYMNVETSDPKSNFPHDDEGASVTIKSSNGITSVDYKSSTNSGGTWESPSRKLAATEQDDGLYNELSSTQKKSKPMTGAEIDDTYDHTGILPNEDIYNKLDTGKSRGVTSPMDDVYDHAPAPTNGDDDYHELDIRSPKPNHVDDTYDHAGNMNIVHS